MLAVAALGLSLTTVVLQLPYAVMDTWIFGLTIPMPTLLGGPLSESGLAQAAFCAIGWLVAVAAPGAIVLRLGGGALRKQPNPAPLERAADAIARQYGIPGESIARHR